MSKLELVKFALAGEKRVSGFAHADNVAACIYGGFTISLYSPLNVVHLNMPKNFEYAVALPEVRISTKESRALLPKFVKLEDAVSNISSASSLIAGILKNDIEMAGRGMSDKIAEPIRKKFIPFYDEVKEAGLNAGAAGVAISGSGPATIALCNSEEASSKEIAEAMREVYNEKNIKCKAFSGKIGMGCRAATED